MTATLPGIMRVVLTYERATDDQIVETFHVPRLGSMSAALLNDYCFEIEQRLKPGGSATGWLSNKPSNIPLRRITTYDMHPGSALAGEVVCDHASAQSTTVLPHQVAAVVTWGTEFRGRSFRGRTYVGPLVATAIDNSGLLTSSFRTTLGGRAGTLLGMFAALGTPMQVASFTHQWSTTITNFRIDDSPDVQRRRQRDSTATTFASV